MKHSSNREDRFAPLCPRCRYDLSGEAARWVSACPLGGICPECGVNVNWAVAHSLEARVPWAYDVPGVRDAAMGRWWATLRRAMRPGLYWREIRDEPIAPGRLVVWGVILIALLHTFLTAWRLLAQYLYVRRSVRGGFAQSFWGDVEQSLGMVLYPIYTGPRQYWRGQPIWPYFADRFQLSLAIGSLAAVVLFLLNRVTVRRKPYVNAPLMRAAWLGMMPIGFMYVMPILGIVVDQVATWANRPIDWWHVWWTPSGLHAGVFEWLSRAFKVITAIWLVMWWWHAGDAVYRGPRGRTMRVLGVAFVCVAAGVAYWRLGDWRV